LYADADALAFATACATGLDGFPELASLWDLLSSCFPRKTSDGRLHLSRLDELIMTLLSTDWQTPLAVFANKSPVGESLRELLLCIGDLVLPQRLDHWVNHGSPAAIERAPGPRGPIADFPMLSFVYRLTGYGVALRADGPKRIEDGPTMPVAGGEAYSPTTPWVVLDGGQLARLVA
jgi:hypothetical protein